MATSTKRTANTRRHKQRDPASASGDRPRTNLVPAQAAAAYDRVAKREKLPVNEPTSVLEACRSVVAATLFYGTDLYHYVQKKDGKYRGRIKVRGINTYTPFVASAEVAAALVTTAIEAHDRRPFLTRARTKSPRTRRPRAGVPQARRRHPGEAAVPEPEPGPLGERWARRRGEDSAPGASRVRRRRGPQEAQRE